MLRVQKIVIKTAHMSFFRLFFWAWRESRRRILRLFLFVASITAGIAGLVAINSFSENLQGDIDKQAKELLGADIGVTGLTAPPDSVLKILDSIPGERSNVVSFVSIGLFKEMMEPRLVNVRAVRGKYPFYGKIETKPEKAADELLSDNNALADQSLFAQFDLTPGDSVLIGGYSYDIIGSVISSPGRTGMQSSVAPAVFIPMAFLDSTSLLQRGSRVEYSYFYKLPLNSDAEKISKNFKKRLDDAKFTIETTADRKKSTSETFQRLTTFFRLIGFISILLGCLGVASAVTVFVQEKIPTVAVLRTIGASGTQAFTLFLLQITFMGIVGAVVGAGIGSLVQYTLPIILKDFLPIENVSHAVSWTSIVQGIVIGEIMAVMFALPPLLSIRQTSPMRTLRVQTEEETPQRDFLVYGVYVLIALFTLLFTYWQTGDIKNSIYFIGGVLAAFAVLSGMAWLLMWLVKKILSPSWTYTLRQSIANLYRPNNQTRTLMTSIGLGTFFIILLTQIQYLLTHQISISGEQNQPNMIVFDIQQSQKDSVLKILADNNMPVKQVVPVITTRLEEINGVTRAANAADSSNKKRSEFSFNREYRVTFRDTLTNSEKLIRGKMPMPGKGADGLIGITLADNIAQGMKADVGSHLTFNVQGVIMKTIVTGIREVNYNKVQTNFLVLFPSGVLEKAPQFYVVVTRSSDENQSGIIQSKLVKVYPNLSIVDVTMILRTVETILTKISYIIRFMASFSIVTGFIVLISSLLLSHAQRLRDSVVLRTLGASRATILFINGLEYLWVGLLSTITGTLLALAASWALARFIFRTAFEISWQPLLILTLGIAALVVIIGLLNTRKIITTSPLSVLRQD